MQENRKSWVTHNFKTNLKGRGCELIAALYKDACSTREKTQLENGHICALRIRQQVEGV